MSDTGDKPISDTMLIKNFFEMSSQEAVKELKNFPQNERQELAEGIRNGSFTY